MAAYDRVYAAELAGALAGERAALAGQAEPLTQIQASFLGRHCEALGLLRWTLGAPPAEVRSLFEEAAAAFERMFALRGTTPPLRVFVTSEDPRTLDDAALRAAERVRADGGADESLTNSWKGLSAVHLALAAGAFDRALRLAREVWDPPDACEQYLGVGSEVCTPAQQRLAYATRDLLLDRADAALARLQAPVPPDDESAADPMVDAQARAVEALARTDAGALRGALGALVHAHAAWAAEPGLARRPATILCLPALALAAEGARRGLLTRADLPPPLPALLLP